MPEIHRFALVPFSPQKMFDLVQDVESYPLFLSWIEEARVHDSSDDHQRATLGLNLAGVRPKFTTLNRLSPPEQVSMRLEEGPFRTLEGQWQFEPMGSGCQVSLDLRFEMNPGLLSSAISRSFGRVADRMVNDFCARAFKVYGHED